MDNNKLDTITNLFEGKEIRSIWNNEKEEYFFSVVDVIGALTDNEYDRARNYWKWLKNKLNEEGSELVSNTNQLKMRSQKDGKNYLTDVLDTKGIAGTDMIGFEVSVPTESRDEYTRFIAITENSYYEIIN